MWVCWSCWTREINRGGHREAGSHPQVWWWGASGRRLDKPSSPLPREPPHSVSGSVALACSPVCHPRLCSRSVVLLYGLSRFVSMHRWHGQSSVCAWELPVSVLSSVCVHLPLLLPLLPVLSLRVCPLCASPLCRALQPPFFGLGSSSESILPWCRRADLFFPPLDLLTQRSFLSLSVDQPLS